jgi:NAD(P)-dependent dehydrogenase (short-subunit alcohol dehydrogenase family)
VKTVLITGTSSGIGYATALLLHHRGYKVFATVRKSEDAAKQPAGITPLLLDLHDSRAIEELPSKLPSPLFALINNAGHNYISPFESHDPAFGRALMETNFFGLAQLTRVLIPHLRAYHQAHPQEYARILNISSIGGLVGVPWESFYHASKFAVVGLTESLRHELWQEGIRPSVICPGGIRTPFIAKTSAEIDANQTDNPRYRASLAKLKSVSSEVDRFGSSPAKVAEAVAELLARRRPPFRVLVGADAKLLYSLSRLLPTPLFHGLLRSAFVASTA